MKENNNNQSSEPTTKVTQMMNDISNHKSKTLVAEQTFRLLVESVGDYGIFLMDPKGFIQSWNLGAERIKGYTADEIIGEHFSKFYLPEDIKRNHPQHEIEIAAKEGKYEEEGWRLRKNGTKFWANVVITSLRDKSGHLVGFAKVTRDLTERKESEEKLRLSEERARRMFEGVKDYAMITLDVDGRVATWNEGARRIKGYEKEEIVGQYFSIFYTHEDVQMGKCEYELQEAKQTGRFEDTGWRVRKDGTKFWATVSITAIRNEKNELIGFSKVTRDITDRKRAEDLLKMSYSNLEKRVDERTRQLSEANEKLKDAIRIRDEFLSIASHELRTPLTPLKLQIQSLAASIKKKSFKQMSEERLERMAETSDKAITRLSALIDNLLDVSRINSGKLTLNYERFDVIEMVKELLDRHKSEIQTSKSLVDVNLPQSIIGHFDRLRLEQIFLNLLTNSLKYGNAKPIKIEVTADNTHLFIKFTDNGIGIPFQDQDRIFERFERVNDDDYLVGGLGLGLYITKQIVDAHGGTIKVQSKIGEGSEFVVKLPLMGKTK